MKNGVFTYKEAWILAGARSARCSNWLPRPPNARPITVRKELADAKLKELRVALEIS
jgi:hypothetical protein